MEYPLLLTTQFVTLSLTRRLPNNHSVSLELNASVRHCQSNLIENVAAPLPFIAIHVSC
jgi:hypothetical protein